MERVGGGKLKLLRWLNVLKAGIEFGIKFQLNDDFWVIQGLS